MGEVAGSNPVVPTIQKILLLTDLNHPASVIPGPCSSFDILAQAFKEMLTAPSYNGTKIGAVIYGLAAGITTLLGIVFVCIVVGILLAWFCDSVGWMGLGEDKPGGLSFLVNYPYCQG